MGWFRRLFFRKRLEAELDKELRFHFESQVSDKVRSGIQEAEARRLTRIEFGGIEQIKEDCRERRGTMGLESFLQDLRYAFRTLRKNVVLTLVILASLGIGIGANSAIFSVVDALLLRPLPYPHPDRLAAVWLHSPGIGILRDWPSPGQYIDIQNQNHSFDQMALTQSRTFPLTGQKQPERVDMLKTQSSLLTMFGAKPLLGRTLLPEEDRPGKPAVAILSNGAWVRLFNSDPAIVGRTIILNGK